MCVLNQIKTFPGEESVLIMYAYYGNITKEKLPTYIF